MVNISAEIKKKTLWKIIVLWFHAVLLFFVLFVFLEIVLILPAAIEQARRKEARSYLAQMRQTCEYLYKEDGNTKRCTADKLGIDVPDKGIPGTCGPSYAFRYSAQHLGNSMMAYIASRCMQEGACSGKQPFRLILTADHSGGQGQTGDSWDMDQAPDLF
jgi:hypothetical protein